MMQVVRNLLDSEDGFLLGKTHLIMDRDPVFTAEVRGFLERSGAEPVRLPARSPNLNAFAERFVLSIKNECLNRLILFGESHFRLAVREYVAHYNRERPHQGLHGQFVVRKPLRTDPMSRASGWFASLLSSAGCPMSPIVNRYRTGSSVVEEKL